MSNSFQSLYKKRLRLLPKRKLFFIFLGVGLVLFTIIDSILIWAVNSVEINNEVINVERINHLILVNTIVVAIFAILINIWLFRVEVDESLIKLDQHYGYEPRNIFLVRLIESVFWLAIFLISIVIINLIFISAAKGYQNSYYYKAYLTSLGWYALGAIAFTGLMIFITSFLKVIWSLIVIMVLLIGFLAVANFSSEMVYRNTTKVKVDSKKEPNSLLVKERNNYDALHVETRISKIYTFLDKEYQTIINPWLEFEQDVNSIVGEVDQSPYFQYIPWFQSAGGTRLIDLVMIEKPQLSNPLTNEKNKGIVDYYTFFDAFFEQHSNDFRSFSLANSGIEKDRIKPKTVISLLKKMQHYDLGNYQKLVDFFEKQYEDSAVDTIARNIPSFYSHFSDFEFLPKKLQDGTINFAQFLFQAVLSSNFDEVLVKVNNDTGGGWEMGDPAYEQEFLKYLQFNKFASRTVKSAIYNPFTQLALMFNGVSYRNPAGYDQMTSGTNAPLFKTNKYAYTGDGWKDISVHRVVKVEGLYIGYLVFFGLLIFASYWIFRSKIK